MTQSKARNRSVGSPSARRDPSVLETRAGRIYRENLSKMPTSPLTKWSSTQVANGRGSSAERPD